MLAVLGSPYVLGLVLATVATFALGVAAVAHRDRPGAVSFGAHCLVLSLWSATTCAGLLLESQGTRLFLERLHWVYVAVVPVLWLSFTSEYAGYADVLTRRRYAALSLVSLGFVVLLFVDYPGSVWTGYDFVERNGLHLVDQSLGPLTVALSLYVFAVTFVGAAVVFRFGLTAGHLYRDQMLAIFVGTAAPILVSLFSMVDLTPLRGLNVTPYALAVSALAFGNAMFRYDFLENAPSTRRFGQHVVTRSLRDGVLVVDDRDRIVECNPVAGRVLGVHHETVLGEDVRDVVDADDLVDGSLDQHLRDDTGTRRYAVERSPVLDQHDYRVGTVYVLRDVTETERREERLAVLNRVLRHNVRNDMNVVDGYATELADRLDGDDAAVADEIADVASDLVDLSQKARTVEAIMADVDTDPRSLAGIVGDLVDSMRHEHPDVAFHADVPDVTVARGTVVYAIVSNVVENAVEHGAPDARGGTTDDDPRQSVRISGSVDDGMAEVVVADDGPGIPEVELRALRNAEESALEHGSGLGLWIVAWGVERLGGTVDVEVDDGTTFTLSLPVAGGRHDPDERGDSRDASADQGTDDRER